MTENDLSSRAQLADKVWRYMIFSGRFNDAKPSELKEKYIIPIFGEDVSNEITRFYLKAKL